MLNLQTTKTKQSRGGGNPSKTRRISSGGMHTGEALDKGTGDRLDCTNGNPLSTTSEYMQLEYSKQDRPNSKYHSPNPDQVDLKKEGGDGMENELPPL